MITAENTPADRTAVNVEPQADASQAASLETPPEIPTESTPEVLTAENGEAQAADQAGPPTGMTEGQRFLAAFGDRGGVWFAQGKTFAEAQEAYIAELRAERDELAARLAQLDRGAQDACQFQPAAIAGDPVAGHNPTSGPDAHR